MTPWAAQRCPGPWLVRIGDGDITGYGHRRVPIEITVRPASLRGRQPVAGQVPLVAVNVTGFPACALITMSRGPARGAANPPRTCPLRAGASSCGPTTCIPAALTSKIPGPTASGCGDLTAGNFQQQPPAPSPGRCRWIAPERQPIAPTLAPDYFSGSAG